ncbi:putative glutamate 5-kinase protein [Botrytis fragariae]|uniref:Putative glutamate 5-kinase protein n=1 Tax=Botrytis fragariae TaxID=1964551 RepID=A0A8H6APV9_9HELO|nr:putative glutamate 5-kinase protein [Botrytis fragariae]KAF5871464.1 putative glutamate 5-kinase protein [Botrytis fragariae]
MNVGKMKTPKSLTIVIKLGTSSIVDEKTHEPLLSILSLIVETAVRLHKDGHKVIIVSSGAIGVGLRRMDLDKRPKHLPRVQALAAIGQCRLISLWDSLFAHLQQPVAQILLTRNDIADRTQYRNAQNTLHELLEMGVIPIVNENDTLAVAEIKFGDNDTLSAITAAMLHADYLFLMTDVDCLYDKNPRTHADAQAIEVVEDISALQADVSSAGSSLGTGGMSTKIVAARLATSAGVTTVITRSSSPGNIASIVSYVQSLKISALVGKSGDIISQSQTPETLTRSNSTLSLTGVTSSLMEPPLHTRFLPSHQPIRDRYFWLLHGLSPHGTIYIDAGAHRALAAKAGLLPAGIVDVEGSFAQQEAVRLVVVERPSSPDAKIVAGSGVEVGRALVNYSAMEIARIKGVRSSEIHGLLGYADSEYVALRENISFFERGSRSATPVLS